MMEKRRVLKGPVITEKATRESEERGKYCFDVDRHANKHEIRRAVESAFKVKVRSVNVLSARGKLKRVRWQVGKTPDWKKAIVTLKKGDKIEYTA